MVSGRLSQPALPGRRELFADPTGDGLRVLGRGGDFGGGGAEWVEGGEKVARFPNVGAGAIGADQTRIAPRVDGQEAVGHRRGEVHGAAVDADDKRGTAQEPEEFCEAGLVEEVGDVRWEIGGFFFTAPDEDDGAVDGTAEGGDGFGRE